MYGAHAHIHARYHASHREKNIGRHPVPGHGGVYTLQGEGAYTGRAAYFIRLGGCDVGCTWCDVKESWMRPSIRKEW